ncbi:hypothetical protein, partial [Pseudomonas viridiflava]
MTENFLKFDAPAQASEKAKKDGVKVSGIEFDETGVPNGLANELVDFILDRLKGYYADKGVPATHFN